VWCELSSDFGRLLVLALVSRTAFTFTAVDCISDETAFPAILVNCEARSSLNLALRHDSVRWSRSTQVNSRSVLIDSRWHRLLMLRMYGG